MLSKARFPLMTLGMLALLTALWGGLVRLGWAWPLPWPTLAIAQGPLMVSYINVLQAIRPFV